MSWKKYFRVIKIVPGKVIFAKTGQTIDLSKENHELSKIKDLYENDFPYLELTRFGANEIYGTKTKVKSKDKVEIETKKKIKVKAKRKTKAKIKK